MLPKYSLPLKLMTSRLAFPFHSSSFNKLKSPSIFLNPTSWLSLPTKSFSTSSSFIRFSNQPTTTPKIERFVDNTDVLIVGGGPAGLSAAIKLKQLALQHNKEIRVMVIEKGAEIGSHILSGNVLEPRALNELIPDWKEKGAPLFTKATKDKMYFLTSKHAIPLPHPPQMHNQGNYIISLNLFVKWLGEQAEALGVELYPGFAGAKPIYSNDGKALLGIQTGDQGLNKSGIPSDQFEPGMELRAPITLLAEGCHGSLTKQFLTHFQLRSKEKFQTYAIGLKEVWEIEKERHQPGLVIHAMGWPTDPKTYQGSFLYHWSDAYENGKALVSVGLVVGLDYWNAYTRPYMEFQRLKHHPAIAKHLEGGKCISYGARALNEGGYQSIPSLAFPGGALLGCAAGFVNVPKIKGTHTAMKSGMVAAEAAFQALSSSLSSSSSSSSSKDATTEDTPVSTSASLPPLLLTDYQTSMEKSWVFQELHQVRNVRPSFRYGLYTGLMYSGLDTLILRGKAPWTIPHHKPDHACLKPIQECPPIEYPKPDGILSFDLLDNLARANTYHSDTQPIHLKPKQPHIHVLQNEPKFGGPEQKFCPAGVYEYIDVEPYELEGQTVTKKFQINAPNCIHCKTCDIKDPSQSIDWTTPEGGGGPNYVLT